MQTQNGAYRTSAKNPPADPVALLIAEVVLVLAVASYGAVLDVLSFFRSRHGRMATLVVVLTTVMAAYQLWDLEDENRQLQAQIAELQSERKQLVNENRDLSWRVNSLDGQLLYDTSRSEHLRRELFQERIFSGQVVPATGNDPLVMDDWGVVCHNSQLEGPEGYCP